MSKKLELAKVWNNHHSFPAVYDLERALGISWRSIKRQVENYRDYQKENPDEDLPDLIYRTPDGQLALDPSIQEQLEGFRFDPDDLKGKKGFVVTSAQYGAPLNKWVWKSFANYCKHRDFPLLVLPIQYGPTRTMKHEGKRKLTSTFPNELEGHVVLDDLEVANGNLRLSTARLRPTLQRFLVDDICKIGRNKSVIFAAPRLELEHRPRLNHKYPKAIMTTGAVTHPNYRTDSLGQQERVGLLAARSHNFAAIVIEFDKGQFHFRQLHANKRGEFYDIDLYCTPKGVEEVEGHVEALVCGDWHTGKTDKTVRKTTLDSMIPALQPKKLVLHDFVDGDSISHHGDREKSRKAFAARMGWNSLEDELQDSIKELQYIMSKTDAEVHLIPSNHPEFVTSYIDDMKWANEYENMEIGADLFLRMIRDLKARKPAKVDSRATDPVVLYFREHVPEAHHHERQDTFMVAGIALSFHGDIGPRGENSRSTKSFDKFNARIVLGHNHSALICGEIWRVGVSTPRMQFYVRNPVTNWTNTHLAIYKNGQRQLVNIINGKWKA